MITKDDLIERIFKYAASEECKKNLEMDSKRSKSKELMKFLEIKYGINSSEDSVKITDLYDILMNEEKLHKLISKLKLKVFW